LVALQFPKIKVQKVLNKILQQQPNINSVEDMIKLALKNLS
jgi:Holliday junction resolvasome RuvABC DNA-binding subunit